MKKLAILAVPICCACSSESPRPPELGDIIFDGMTNNVVSASISQPTSGFAAYGGITNGGLGAGGGAGLALELSGWPPADHMAVRANPVSGGRQQDWTLTSIYSGCDPTVSYCSHYGITLRQAPGWCLDTDGYNTFVTACQMEPARGSWISQDFILAPNATLYNWVYDHSITASSAGQNVTLEAWSQALSQRWIGFGFWSAFDTIATDTWSYFIGTGYLTDTSHGALGGTLSYGSENGAYADWWPAVQRPGQDQEFVSYYYKGPVGDSDGIAYASRYTSTFAASAGVFLSEPASMSGLLTWQYGTQCNACGPSQFTPLGGQKWFFSFPFGSNSTGVFQGCYFSNKQMRFGGAIATASPSDTTTILTGSGDVTTAMEISPIISAHP